MRPLPRRFDGHRHAKGLVHEADIKLTRRAKLAAKLLVFKDAASLHKFWWKSLGHELGDDCLGAVNSLSATVMTFKRGVETIRYENDPRYFCVIGLVKGRCGMEVMAHESVHAAYAYVKRLEPPVAWARHAKHFDEEEIAYPAGRIAAEINRELWDAGVHKA